MANKNWEEKKRRRLYLPLSILIPFGTILFVLIILLIYLGPLAVSYLEWMMFDGIINPIVPAIIFLIALFLIIFLLTYMVRLNERIRRMHEKEALYMEISDAEFHGKYRDSDRSYLEQQIAQLSDQLLSSQMRWEEVNHLVLSLHEKNISSSGVISSESLLERFNIDPNDIEIDKELVFVLTPFHDDNISDFNQVKQVCNNIKLRALRGDEENIKGDILSHIVRCMLKARIIVANISGRNPNVFYELGIAHMMNKPTILISRNESDIPFDLKNRFVIIYNSKLELEQKLSTALLQALAD